MSEASKLAAFLLALQTSPGTKKRFKHNPKAEMSRFDLRADTMNAILGKDAKRLRRILRIPPIHVGHVTGVEKGHRRRKSKRT